MVCCGHCGRLMFQVCLLPRYQRDPVVGEDLFQPEEITKEIPMRLQ